MGIETFAVASDYHGDRHDPVARRAFKRFNEEFKPKLRVFLGDLFDFRALRVNASPEEKEHSMQADFDAGMEFLDEYRPHVLTLGNHDQRLWDAYEKDGLRKRGPIADLAKILLDQFASAAEKLKVRVLPYDKRKGVWSHSGIKGVHGFDGLDPVNMAAIYGNVFYGHGHRIESASAPSEESKVARMIGGLMLKDMTYNRAQTKTLGQQHGWAYGTFLPRNRFGIMQAELLDGQFSYAKTVETITV